MGILIREGVDPLSRESFESPSDSVLVHAPSEAGRLLRQELERYCAGQLNGRSFLIAGHRGAGKTTMVAAALDSTLRKVREKQPKWLQPLPVFLHGPGLFAPSPTRRAAPELAEQAKDALVQVILGLHRAGVGAFVRGYRDRLKEPGQRAFPTRAHWGDAAELAAQFEIEVLEDPTATRLREFWEHAGLTRRGALFKSDRPDDQGYRELVALNGLCNAHRRISGDLQAKDTTIQEHETKTLPSSLAKLRAVELVKPISAVFAGSTVAAGGAIGTGHLAGPAVLGVLGAFLATMLFESGGETTERRSRQLDTVFIPDLTLKTLDRVLPILLHRLRCAGLAPVFVVDELDKVDDLPNRLRAMILFLKKLVAEDVFTCFLTDRSYIEHLRIAGRGAAYDLAFSYFSHPLLVSHRPRDFEQFLEQTLRVDAAADSGDELDLQVLPWVLRHRSQLHALALKRELAAIRGDDEGRITIPRGYVRSESTYCIDLTLQFAIELQLRERRLIAWQRQHPNMMQVLHDALYYLSRLWLDGGSTVDVNDAGKQAFFDAIVKRMNLEEVRHRTPHDPAASPPPALTDDDKQMLWAVHTDMVTFLRSTTTVDQARRDWSLASDGETDPNDKPPQPAVWRALLLEAQSLLVDTSTAGKYEWRFSASGVSRAGEGVQLTEAKRCVPRIEATEARLRDALIGTGTSATTVKPVFAMLSEDWSILPSTPAWSRVSKAMDTLRPGSTTAPSEEDCRAVVAFAERLKLDDERLVRLLANAAMLAAVAAPVPAAAGQPAQGPDPEGLRRALQALADGLQFASREPSDVDAALTMLQQQVHADFGYWMAGDIPAHLPSRIDGVAANRLKNVLATSHANGLELAKAANAKRNQTVERAWTELRGRLESWSSSSPPEMGVAHASEIVCALWKTGPTAVMGLNPATATLAHWSACALAATADREPPPERVPRWLGYFAFDQLGAGNVEPSSQERLMALLTNPAAGSKAPAGAEEIPRLQREHPWAGTPGASRVVVLFRHRVTSLSARWTGRPGDGLFFSLDWADEPAVRAMLVQKTPMPGLLPAAEQLSTAPTPENMQRLVVDWGLGENAPWLWVCHRAGAGNHQPTAIDPQGPEDLFVHVRSQQPRPA